MNIGPIQPADLLELIPYGVLILGSLFILCASMLIEKRSGFSTLGFCAVVVVLTAGFFVISMNVKSTPFDEMLIHDGVGLAFSEISLLILLMAIPMYPVSEGTMSEKPGVILSLLLLAACGSLFMIFSNHLVLFFVGLELLSLPLYVLSGLGTDEKKGSEAAFKYFLLGAFSSSLYIFGTALLWGALGTVKISQMGGAFVSHGQLSLGTVLVGTTLVLSGLAFKLGLVPFQMWLPDVYEGAPSYIVAWMSGAVKVSVLPIIVRLLTDVFPYTRFQWSPVLEVMALASMLWGSFGALAQTNVKRILAYSTIANAGYGTIAIICAHEGYRERALSALAFYFLAYGIGNLISFVVLSTEEARGKTSISDLAGLAKQRPGIALIFSVGLLSLAGLPPLGGFFGKFNVFALGVESGHIGLVVIAVLTSVVSLAYYLRIIVAMYMEDSHEASLFQVKWRITLALSLCSLGIAGLGITPSYILQLMR